MIPMARLHFRFFLAYFFFFPLLCTQQHLARGDDLHSAAAPPFGRQLRRLQQSHPRLHTLFSVECTPYFDWQTVGMMQSYR